MFNCTVCLASSQHSSGCLQPLRHRRRRGRQTFTTYNKPVRNMQVCGWAQTAGQEGCEKSRPTPVLTSKHSSPERVAIATTVLWLSLTSLQAPYSLSTPSAQVIFFSRYVSPTLCFSPVSVHNALHLHSAELCVVLNRQRLEILLLFVCCGVHIL